MNNNPMIKLKGIGKEYSGNIVLHDIDMEISSGEIIGLVGENGAGKSTLLKLLSGLESPSFGTMELQGKPYAPRNTLDGNHNGIGMVFQEQSIIKNWSIAENLFIGREKKYKKYGLIMRDQMNKAAESILFSFNINQKPDTKVSKLDFASRQMIEISKIFDIVTSDHKTGVILLDEPTSVLTKREIETLFKKIRSVKETGYTVIFVSHRFDEVLEISDLIYVLKDGAMVCCVDKNDAKEEFLYEQMTGRATTGEYYKESLQTVPEKEVVMKVTNLSKYGYFNKVSFEVRKGDIVGICGLEGSGVEELCNVLSGNDDFTEGTITVRDRTTHKMVDASMNTPYVASKRYGILSIPKNRSSEGIIGGLPIGENIIMSNLAVASQHGLISDRKLSDITNTWIEKLKIHVPEINAKASQLSGGNAQKVVFARIMYSNSDIFILNHPTRGVDVGAKEEIYNLIRNITNTGGSAILVGDTLDESLGMSSQLIVMKDGVISAKFETPVGNKPSQADVVKYML